jgi:pimeloyl-ACP methyl ester carboxylesterase
VAFLRASRRERTRRAGRDAIRPLASLAGQALGSFPRADVARVLVVHARDDHHVPVDFAIAAAQRHPAWDLRLLDGGGHHAHVSRPTEWIAVVGPWLEAACR